MRLRSTRPIKRLEDVLLPFRIVFPETIEGSVNSHFFLFKKGERVTLSLREYETIAHSSYAKYLGH